MLAPSYLISVRDPTIVLAPTRLRRVVDATRTGDIVVNVDLGAAHVAELFLSHVRARAIEAVCLLMVDSRDLDTLMQIIP